MYDKVYNFWRSILWLLEDVNLYAELPALQIFQKYPMVLDLMILSWWIIAFMKNELYFGIIRYQHIEVYVTCLIQRKIFLEKYAVACSVIFCTIYVFSQLQMSIQNQIKSSHIFRSIKPHLCPNGVLWSIKSSLWS